ncbi:DUF885 domain-containing protein [Phenylobacterium sp.]|uniref:DUF885 domain-containing protein n=1 Tax=Phenylobacterium sp. TaxID=1871053 RepID=UPI002DF167C5|nr:DUF885 family protein [Phenylobacterium sp.]
MHRRSFMATAGALALTPARALAAPGSDAALYDAVLEAVLRASPETATSYGLDAGPRAGLKHRLDDRGAANRLSYFDAIIDAGPRLASAAPPATPRAAIFRAMAASLADNARPFRGFAYGGIGGFGYPVANVVTQVSGAYQDIPDFLATQHTIATADDASAYLDRLTDFGRVVDQETEQVRADAGRGVTPPGFLIDRTLAQLGSFQAEQRGPTAGLVRALADRTAGKTIAGDWAGRAQAIVDGPVAAAIARQAAALAALRPHARETAGVGALPDGQAYYAHCLRFQTTTNLSPDAAHALGLEQVTAVTAQTRAVLDQAGVRTGTVSQGMAAISRDPAQLFPDTDAGRAEMLDYIRARLKDMYARLPRVFETLPRTALEVRRVPPANQLGSPGAYSLSGSIDGTRPGAIYFNQADTRNWPRWSVDTTVYHEGVPGHHLQGSIANETADIPTLFKLLNFNAYAEGWALYAEQLADELGAYDDHPLGRLGRLQGSLFRACRIVVDTGLHARGWTRERAIAFLVDKAGSTPDDARREIERYCAWPGQACGYKIGHLEFLRLRQHARDRLGARFDIKGFHRTVLEQGAMPLDAMGVAVDGWIRRRAAA